MSDEIDAGKRAIRTRMRDLRRSVDDPAGRSAAIWSHVRREPSVIAASVVMAYASVPGEPDSAGFLAWCATAGKQLIVPEAHREAVAPTGAVPIDVVIVPGLAFTRRGERLGQGGGWYDRFLASAGGECTTIGVAFAEQILDEIPVDDHDVGVDVVITDEGRIDG